MTRLTSFARAAAFAMAALLAGSAAGAQEPSRPFHMGFTPLPPVYSAFGQGIAYAYLQQHGDLVSHTLQHGVPWAEALASSDWRTYPAGLRASWESIALYDGYFLPGHARYVSIHPIDYAYRGLAGRWAEGGEAPLEAPWAGRGFDHPEVKQAFLNYAIAAVEFFRPTYLGLAVEANILLARAPERWQAYKALNAYVYTELKRRYPSLVVFPTVQYEHMLGLQRDSAALLAQVRDWYPTVLEDEVRDLLHHSDLFVLSTYPFMVEEPGAFAPHFEAAIAMAARSGRRLAVEQAGFTSKRLEIYGTALPGTEALQADFVGTLLDLAAERELAFVVNFVAIDYAHNYGTDPIAMTWAYTGLWRADGTPKPAADIWRARLGIPRAPLFAESPR